jgi:hypothetical protein
MVETQLGRRNLSALQRVQIAEKYRPVFKRKAELSYKENVGRPSEDKSLQKSSTIKETIHTRDELAKVAKVSHDTYGKAKKIIDLEEQSKKGEVNLSEEQKQVIEKAKKDEIKVNTAFKELFGKPKVDNKLKQETKEEEDKINTILKENIQLNKIYDLPLDKKVEADLSSNTKDIINHLKKDKLISDYFNFEGLIDCTVVSILEAIDIADSQMFSYEPIDGVLTKEQQVKLLSEMDKVIVKINAIKNKINNINLKENKIK